MRFYDYVLKLIDQDINIPILALPSVRGPDFIICKTEEFLPFDFFDSYQGTILCNKIVTNVAIYSFCIVVFYKE